MIFFLITFFTLFTLIAWRSLPNAFFILIALLPSYLIRFYIWAFPTTMLEGMIAIIIGVWFFQTGFRQIKKRYKKETAYQKFPFQNQIILIITASIISIFIAPDFYKALGLWRAYFLEPVLLFLVFIQTINNKKDLKKILYALGVSALTVSVFAIYQKITGKFIPIPMWRPEEVRRVTSFFTSPNTVGLYLAPIVMIYLGWLAKSVIPAKAGIHSTIDSRLHPKGTCHFVRARGNDREKLWKIIVLTLSTLAIIFTKSEGAWAGLIVGIICFFILYTSLKIKNFFKKFKVALIFIILTIIISSPLYFNLLQKKFDKIIKTPSAQNRIILWQGSWEFLTTSPNSFIFGAGIFGFPQIQDNFRDPLKMEPLIYPHNIFLNFWMDIGLIGMIGFTWLIASFFKKTGQYILSKKSFFTAGLFCAMVTIAVHGLIDVPYFKNDLAVLFWLIIGIYIIHKNVEAIQQ